MAVMNELRNCEASSAQLLGNKLYSMCMVSLPAASHCLCVTTKTFTVEHSVMYLQCYLLCYAPYPQYESRKFFTRHCLAQYVNSAQHWMFIFLKSAKIPLFFMKFGNFSFFAGCDFSQVREEVCSFLQDSPTENLILFLAGHGTQQRRQYRPVRESLLIPTPTPGSVEYYTDAQLTEDIADNLPEDKKLYIIIHACHSGGMLNLWEIDTSERWIALFASAEADILAKWSANDEDQTYIDTFCECAKRGETLAEIAGRITRTYADVHDRVRPAFVTSNPDIALDTFL